MTQDEETPISWDLLLRYRLIEIIALWEGRLSSTHLCNAFGIGRQQASKDIGAYTKELAPGNLEYDGSLKGYKPTPAFCPKFTQGIAEEYLLLLTNNNQLGKTFKNLALGMENTELLNVPIRDVKPEIIRAIVTAARQQKRLDVDYVSMHAPDREGRVIVPHTIVHTGLRWHVRAWCEKNSDYRDFVLSRFRGTPEIMDMSEHGVDADTAWQQEVTINLKPDRRLTEAQQSLVAADYGMTDNQLNITTRGCLVHYALWALRVDTKDNALQDNPVAQQIVVTNMNDLRRWLF
ncbi:MAG: WYL domain-containing protein [Motiliproteus sp.]